MNYPLISEFVEAIKTLLERAGGPCRGLSHDREGTGICQQHVPHTHQVTVCLTLCDM